MKTRARAKILTLSLLALLTLAGCTAHEPLKPFPCQLQIDSPEGPKCLYQGHSGQ